VKKIKIMNQTTAKSQNGISNWVFHVDRILRGEATKPSDIRKNADIGIPIFGVAAVVVVLAAIYGCCMGVFALVHGFENSAYQRAILQTFASMCKVPLLFFLTLVVTFPSLYVFNALVGSRLRAVPVLKLLIASLAVNLAVLASMGPILAFFSVSTPSYSFIVLLNVVVFAIAGLLGLAFLIQTLNRLSLAESGRLPRVAAKAAVSANVQIPKSQAPSKSKTDGIQMSEVQGANMPNRSIGPGQRPGPLDSLEGVVLGHHVKKVFRCWIVMFGLVGAQMGWVLRPFIGAPNTPFSWFRARSSNFFQAVAETLYNLF
jgi:hypothetical protein